MITTELKNKILGGMGRYAVMKELNIGESQARKIVNAVKDGITLTKPKAVASVKAKKSSAVAKPKAVASVKVKKSITKLKSVAKPKKSSVDVVWMIGSNFASITLDGKPTTIDKSHKNFALVTKLCFENNEVSILKALALMDIKSGIKKYTNGKVTITENETVLYDGLEIDSSLTQRIISNMREDKPIIHLVRFFENLMQNPTKTAIPELFGFLKANDIKLTEDGCFIAWKRVDSNYKDLYSGTIDNSIGKRVEIPRKNVVIDSKITCAAGLHVCSKSYLSHYHSGTGVIIACKVNPKDVVSIPEDYKNAKMRCCGYDVVENVTDTIGI